MKTHNLPKAGLLLFSSTYSKGSSRFKYVFRVLTQVFTFSKYEHCGSLIQCPMSLNGKIVKDYQGKVVVDKNGIPLPWKGGQYYVFEALGGKVNKNIVRSLDGFLDSMQNVIEKRTVQIELQECRKMLDNGSFEAYNPEENFEVMFLNLASQINEPYTTAWTVYSAFNHISFVRKVLKFFKIKPALSDANFCSLSATLSLQAQFDGKMNKEIAVGTTPEELRLHNIAVRKFPQAKPFIEFRDGKEFVKNPYYFECK